MGKENLLSLLPDFVAKPDPTLYIQGTPLFLDFETTNLDKGSALNPYNRLVFTCWKLGWTGEVKHNRGTEYEQQELLEDIAKADFIVAHNAKFELQWLTRCGLDISKVLVYDTMLAEYVIGGNRWQYTKLSLEKCLQRRGLPGKVSIVSKMLKAGICPSDVPEQWLEEYGIRDVEALPGLMRRQLNVMRGTRLLPVLYSRCLLTPVLADIEQHGMRLDGEKVRELHAATTAELRSLEIQMNELTGGTPIKAGPQLAALLYDKLGFAELMVKKGREWVPLRTASGRPSTSSDTIEKLKARTKEQQRFLELYFKLNDAKQALSKYLDKFLACVEENDGLLHFSFNQTNTATHRLSSSGAKYKTQGQNMPRSYKSLFRAPDGWLMGEADGAQLEFRVAAHLGRDEVALKEIADGFDVHAATAKVLTEAGQPTSRQEAKSRSFRPLYGGQSGTEAEVAYNKYFRDHYKGISTAQQRWIAEALRTQQVETEWGLVYYFPGTKMDRSGYVTNTTSICNYPVQAFATAEIIPLCLVGMWHVLRRSDRGVKIVNTIHDSIAAEVREQDADWFRELSRWALTEFAYEIVHNLYGIDLVVQLGCGVKVGSHWGTGEEVKYEGSR